MGRHPIAMIVADCTVWWAVPEQGLLGSLDDTERRRLARLARPADRARFATGATLLRRVAAAELGRPPGAVTVNRTCPTCPAPHGRPTLPGTGLHVSVSHSGARVAVAVTRLGPVGVDVEMVDGGAADIADRVLGDGEILDRPDDLIVYWTRKEAATKAFGDGLRAGLQRVLVSRPQEPARLRAYPGRSPAGVRMADLHPGPGYVAALAMLSPHQPLIAQRWVTR